MQVHVWLSLQVCRRDYLSQVHQAASCYHLNHGSGVRRHGLRRQGGDLTEAVASPDWLQRPRHLPDSAERRQRAGYQATHRRGLP